MSKSVFQTFDVNALTLFGLDTTPLVGVVSNSDLEVADILLTDSETTYSNIRRKLTDNEVTTIGSGTYKKAFLYPKCPVSLTRVKEALKEHGIRLVNSIEDAYRCFLITDLDYLVCGNYILDKKLQYSQKK